MNPRFLFPILILTASCISTGCMRPPGIHVAKPEGVYTISPARAFVLTDLTPDSTNFTPFLEIFSKNDNASVSWLPCADSFLTSFFHKNPDTYFRFTITNNRSDTMTWLFCSEVFDYTMLEDDSGHVTRAGKQTSIRELNYPPNYQCHILSLPAGHTRTYYMFCRRITMRTLRPIYFYLRTTENERNFRAWETQQRMPDTFFLFFYLGFLSFCFIYFLAQYFFRSGQSALLVYALYLLFTLLYSFRDVDKHSFIQNVFTAFNGINTWEAVFSYLSYIFYFLFLIYLLELKKERSRAYHFIMVVISLIVILLVLDIIFRIAQQNYTAHAVFTKSRTLLFPCTLIYFWLIFPYRGLYYGYFLAGTIFLVVGSGVNLLAYEMLKQPSSIFHDQATSRYSFWSNTVNYTRLGVVLEVIFFSLGLAKKMQAAYAEAMLMERSLLETKFHTHEVKSGIITLSTQIEHPERANRYLKLYSRYLVKALESMRMDKGVTLSGELDLLKAYFDLRQNEQNNITLEIENPDQLDTGQFRIPGGLMTGFIQNFFRYVAEAGFPAPRFCVKIYQAGKHVNMDIADNGPGFEDIAVLTKPGSSGLHIAQRQIFHFNFVNGAKTEMVFHNRERGTGILITIAKLYKPRS